MLIKKDTMPVEVRHNMRGGEKSAVFTALAEGYLPQKARIFSTIELEPGASIGHHEHVGECELFYFMQGEGHVKDNDETLSVQAGDTLVTPSGNSHSVQNTGNTPLVFVAVIVMD